MLKYIKSQYSKFWTNPYLYYDIISSDMMSYFGVMTLFSTFFGIALGAVGIAKLTGSDGLDYLPVWGAIVMIVLGVITIATCIIYGILADYLADNWGIDKYDPKKILMMVDTTIMQLCSGFFVVLLALGIVIESFTLLLYTLPLTIIKIATKKNNTPENTKADRIKEEFLSYNAK